MLVLYNGRTGSLGRYFEGALDEAGLRGRPLETRLEAREQRATELTSHLSGVPKGAAVSFVPMAAMVSVPLCEEKPDEARLTNVVHTTRAAEDFIRSCRERNLAPSLVYVSSGHVYKAPREGEKVDVDAPTGPRSVYAATKLEAEHSLTDLAVREGVPLVIARVFGLVAPIQPAHYVLHALIRRVEERRLDDIPGLTYVRDYLDARDVCRTLVALASLDGTSDRTGALTLNVCSGEGIRIRDLVDAIVRAKGEGEPTSITGAPGRAGDMTYLVGDPSRTERILGRPILQISLAETVRDALQRSA